MSERSQGDNTPRSTAVDQGGNATTAVSTPTSTSLQPGSYSAQARAHERDLPPPAAPSRSASFSNLLNPSSTEHGLRKAGDSPHSPSSSSAAAAAASLPSFKHGRQAAALPGPSTYSASFEPPRRILTPRSPSLHRAASLSHLGSIDAHRSPFLNSPSLRTYSIEPGAAGVPPLPKSRSFVPPSPSAVDRRVSGIKRSPSISPRTSNAPQYGSRSSPGSATLPSISDMQQYNQDLSQRPLGIPISSAAGPNVYQMMTIQTGSGTTVQVPVDVQAASRVADEKRRRNAGASARFRARRKEKEKESSSTIYKLETQVKDLQEDVEFYRRERGYLAGILLQMPGGERHFPRPQSPRHRRSSIGMQASNSGSGEFMSSHERSHSPAGDRRNVRRRTSTLSLPIPAPTAGPTYHNYEQQQQHQQLQQQPPLPPPSSGHYFHQHHHQHQHQHQHQSLPGPASLLPPMHPPQSQPSTSPWQAQPYDHRQDSRDRHAR